MSGRRDFDDDDLGGSDFDDVIGLLREGPIEIGDEQPSPELWAGIAGELGLSDAKGVVDAARVDEAARGGDVAAAEPSNVVSLDERRITWGRPAALVTLAAAVILLLAVPIGLSLRSGGDDAELIAAADLDLLEGQSGNEVLAELLSIDGDLVIDVDAPTTVGEGEFLELWLLEVGDDGVQNLESLGRVDGSGRYDVPDGVDLDRFSVVDISVEPDDGNPDHSGVSVVRGELA